MPIWKTQIFMFIILSLIMGGSCSLQDDTSLEKPLDQVSQKLSRKLKKEGMFLKMDPYMRENW